MGEIVQIVQYLPPFGRNVLTGLNCATAPTIVVQYISITFVVC